MVLPLAALGLAQGLEAQAAGAPTAEGASDAWVDAATLNPVVEVIPQTDGSVVLVLPGQQVVRFGAEAVRIDGDTVLVPRLEAFAKGLATAEGAVALQSLADLPNIVSAELGSDGTLTVRFADGREVTIDEPELASAPGAPPAASLSALQAMGLVPVAAEPPSARTLDALAEQPVAAAGNTILAAGGAMLGGLALALGSGGGGSDSAAPTVPTIPTVPTASNTTGFVIDGYLAGATVTRGTSTVTTNDQGFFSGLGGPAVAPIVVSGGVDITTGQNFTGVLSAPGSATVVTPLTTLVMALVADGQSEANALAAVTEGLGLPASLASSTGAQSLLNFDPLATLANPSASAADQALALEVFKRGVEVATVTQRVAQGDEDRFVAVTAALAEGVATGGVDPTDGATLTTLLTAAGAPQELIDQVPELVAAVTAVRAADSVEAVALVQQVALAEVPGVAPENAPELPAPTLTAPEDLSPAALAQGLDFTVAVPGSAAALLPASARATVVLSTEDTVLARLISGAPENGVFTVTVGSAALEGLSGARFTVSATIAAPGTGLVSPSATLEATLSVLEAVNGAATTAALDGALAALEAGGLLGGVPGAVLTGAQRSGALADLLAARPSGGFADLDALEGTLSALGALYDGVAAVEKGFAAGPTLAALETAARTLQSLAATAEAAGITTFQGTAFQPSIDAVETELARIALLSPAGQEALGDALNSALILAAADAIEAGTTLALSDALGLVAEAFPAALGVRAALAADTGASASDGITQNGVLTFTAEPNAALALSTDGGASFAALAARSATLPEGSYAAGALQVRASLGGATVVTKLGALTIDSTAPAAPTLTLPGSDGVVADASTEASFTFSGTAEAGSAVRLSWGDAQAVTTATAEGAWSLTVAAADRPGLGSTAVSVTATDFAGNVSGVTTKSLTLADSAPDIGVGVPTDPPDEIVDAPPLAAVSTAETLLGEGALGAVTFTVTGLDSDASGTLRLTDGITVVDAPVTQNGDVTLDLSALQAGEVVTTLRLEDSAGNRGSVSGPILTLDRTADGGDPATLSVANGSFGAAEAEALAFAVAGLDRDATGTVRFSDGADAVTVAITANGAGSADLSVLAEGAITTDLTVSDAAGNTTTVSGPTLTLDRTAPSRPTLDVISGDGFVNGAEAAAGVTVSGRGDPGLTLTLSWDGETRSATIGDDGAWSAVFAADAVPADGTYTVTVSAVTDAAGNESAGGASGLVTVDRTADGGDAAGLSFGAAVLRADVLSASPFTVFGLDDDATATLRFSDGTTTVTAAVAANVAGRVDLSDLADGAISATLVVTDQAGNTVTRSGGTTEIDRTPASVLFTGETGLFLNGEALASGVSLTGSASNVPAGAEVTVTLGSLTGTSPLTVDGTWTVDFPASSLATLAPGETALTVSVPDGAGGTVSATRTVTVDGTAPTVSLSTALGAQDSAAFSEALEGGALLLQGTASADTASLTITLGTATVTATVSAGGAFTASLPRDAFAEGANPLTFTAVDGAGNGASGNLGSLTLDRLSDLNALGSAAAAPDGFLAALGEATGIAENTLAGLDAQGQSTVLGALIANRPSGGYGSLEALETVLTPVAAYGAQFTALRALRAGTVDDLDLDAFGAAVDGAVGLTLGGEVLTQAAVDALEAGLARLAALQAADPEGYAALLPLAATLALGNVTEASLTAALGRLEAGLAGDTLAFNAYDLTPARITEFEDTLARLSDGAVATLTGRLAETDLTRFAEPLSSLQDALLRGILADVRTLDLNLPPAQASSGEVFRDRTIDLLTDLIINNPAADRALTAADFQDGGRIDVLRSGLVIAENDPDISLDFGISIGALKVESAALKQLLDVFAAYGDPADELTVTPGQAALVASVAGQLEFDLKDATLAELNGAGSKAALGAALARLEAVSLLTDPGLGTVAFASDSARQSAADALFEARIAAGGEFASFAAAAEAFTAALQSTGTASASAASLGDESASADDSGLARDSDAPTATDRTGTAGDDVLVGTDGNDRFLPGAGDDHLELGAGVDTVVLASGGEGQGTDTLYGFLFGPESEGGDVLNLPGAEGSLTVLPAPVAELSAEGVAEALAALQGALEEGVTYVLAQQSAPAEGLADVAMALVVVTGGELTTELLLRFVDAGPSLGALDAHNLPDFSGL